MAIDLSGEPTEHLYRHDLESLFYVLVWITSRFNDGKDIPDPPLQVWAEGEHQRGVDSKDSFILKPSLIPTKQNDSHRSGVSSPTFAGCFLRDMWQEVTQLKIRDSTRHLRVGRKPHSSPTTRSVASSRLTLSKKFSTPTYHDMYAVCPCSIIVVYI